MKFIPPQKLPSANIKAEIYTLLRSKNIKCCLDYRLATQYGELATLSVVIIEDGQIKAAIVVKSVSMDGRPRVVNTNTKRHKKYESFGIKLFTCGQFKDAKRVVDMVEDYIK